jgi:hypothetical protein
VLAGGFTSTVVISALLLAEAAVAGRRRRSIARRTPSRDARARGGGTPSICQAPPVTRCRHHFGQPGGGEHPDGPPRQLRAASGQQLALCPRTTDQRYDLRPGGLSSQSMMIQQVF